MFSSFDDTCERVVRWCSPESLTHSLTHSNISPRYTRELDTGCAGISGCIKRFESTLSNADIELATHLSRQGVRSEFYAFRWLVTLNSREFELPEVLRLWDAIFSDRRYFRKDGFIYNFCAAMLISRRDELLGMGFTELMSQLQQPEGGMLLRNDFESLFMTGMALNSGKSVVNGNKSRLARKMLQEKSKAVNESLNKMYSHVKSRWLNYRKSNDRDGGRDGGSNE